MSSLRVVFFVKDGIVLRKSLFMRRLTEAGSTVNKTFIFDGCRKSEGGIQNTKRVTEGGLGGCGAGSSKSLVENRARLYSWYAFIKIYRPYMSFGRQEDVNNLSGGIPYCYLLLPINTLSTRASDSWKDEINRLEWTIFFSWFFLPGNSSRRIPFCSKVILVGVSSFRPGRKLVEEHFRFVKRDTCGL